MNSDNHTQMKNESKKYQTSLQRIIATFTISNTHSGVYYQVVWSFLLNDDWPVVTETLNFS